MKKILFPLLISAFLFSLIYSTSCRREDSVNINQDRIYTLYEMEYSANEDQTTGRATFRMGGQYDSKLKLSEGSSIKFNGEEMSFQGVYAYYQDKTDGYTENGTFRFEDLDGNVYNNSASLISVEFPETLPDIEKGASYEIEWTGLPLDEGESIKLSVDGPMDSDTKTFTVTATDAQSITLSSTETQTLSAGATILKMERLYETENIETPPVGGKLKTAYTAANHAINVVE
ncbi:MAG: hypothetical protein ACOCXO_02200 [Bacteroidota bacterium]